MIVRSTLMGLLAAALLAGLLAGPAGCKNQSDQQGDKSKAGNGGAADMSEAAFVPGQTRCPVSGEPINRQFFTEYQGKKVYFCCKDCIGPFTKDPQKFLAKLQAQGQPGAAQPPPAEHGMHEHTGTPQPPPAGEGGATTRPEQTGAAGVTDFIVGQATCPVMGNAIDKAVFTDYQGKRVYFCCPGCIEPFNKEPAKFLAKLQAQGGAAPVPVPSGEHGDHTH